MSSSSATHHPQLDALRAFAVGAVLLAHFSPTIGAMAPGLGFAGVRLFFVLSGFLITGILLRARDTLHAGRSSVRKEMRRFLVRRALRILPAFYVLLLINVALNIGSTRADFWWHATHLSNVPMGASGQWRDLLTHLWSLAVEQQFYLVWPWLLLAWTRASPPTLLVTACAAAPGFRLACMLYEPGNTVAPIVLTPACIDLLAAGGLIAWLDHSGVASAQTRRRFRQIGLGCLPLAIVCASALPPSLQSWQTILGPTIQAFAFAALVDAAALGFNGAAGKLLTWRPLLWMGSISYGIYLFHNNAHWLGPRILRQLTNYQLAYFPSEALHVAYLTGISIAAAAVSWHTVERPVLRLKSRLAK